MGTAAAAVVGFVILDLAVVWTEVGANETVVDLVVVLDEVVVAILEVVVEEEVLAEVLTDSASTGTEDFGGVTVDVR